ncbi:protein EARLY FLOWERING 3-like [Silene latifolia]|uniref:protein EARLY FLOWERING 3-like n=1 Tax=Silene latifolia TaxID=37657 RepID=UPI003D780C76
MKRGKDDEKVMEPMFPRLHVNDTEKGGPRAPPRNKMALYEQLTIPSQRYNSSVMPPKQDNSGGGGLVSSTSTSQGTPRKQNTVHFYRSPFVPAYDEIQVRNAEALTLNNQLVCEANKRKRQEEDDFMVPVFSQEESEMFNEKTQHNIDGEGNFNLSSAHQGLPSTVIGEVINESNNGHPVSKQHIKDQDENILRVSSPSRNPLHIATRGQDDVLRQNDASLPWEDQENQRLDNIDANQYAVKESVDRSDDVSETSMVDSASEFDITPDDVVDVIGRKHFWKARSAIVNQQRLFDVQVFELHRLLKVQKLLAASPNLLLEVGIILSKSSSLKVSSVKQQSSEYVVKVVPHKVIPKDAAYKSIDKAEGTAENVVPKVAALVPSRQHVDHPTGYLPVNMDPKMNPWGFHQPSSPQWLVPVMSPSEGLVYKPFPAPGFAGPFCEGYGPFGPNPVLGNYGVPPPQYQQAAGMPPGVHFDGQSYFPPYGMPMISPSMSGSTVVQSNPFSIPNPVNPTGQSEGASRCSESPEDAPPREKRARVIKAVPHRSSRESAARIFQSIQQERQANESSSAS